MANINKEVLDEALRMNGLNPKTHGVLTAAEIRSVSDWLQYKRYNTSQISAAINKRQQEHHFAQLDREFAANAKRIELERKEQRAGLPKDLRELVDSKVMTLEQAVSSVNSMTVKDFKEKLSPAIKNAIDLGTITLAEVYKAKMGKEMPEQLEDTNAAAAAVEQQLADAFKPTQKGE